MLSLCNNLRKISILNYVAFTSNFVEKQMETGKYKIRIFFLQDGRSGRTVLHYAVESGNLDAVRFVAINCQADVNATTFDGSTPLKLAVGRGFHTAANLLVQAGADRSVLNSDEDSDSSESEDESGGDEEVSNQQIYICSIKCVRKFREIYERGKTYLKKTPNSPTVI